MASDRWMGLDIRKIIIACDSYKGCLSSREVNEAIASGVKEWNAEDASPEMKNLLLMMLLPKSLPWK